ncbi:hypothetical protein G9A89_016934 [Geosiphon pyriformis]|nr:hypothetical protein G9A89_016934 [Geosiphon pyriformis]
MSKATNESGVSSSSSSETGSLYGRRPRGNKIDFKRVLGLELNGYSKLREITLKATKHWLDYALTFKQQGSQQVIAVYQEVYRDYPDLKSCENDWIARELTRSVFNSHQQALRNKYKQCVQKGNIRTLEDLSRHFDGVRETKRFRKNEFESEAADSSLDHSRQTTPFHLAEQVNDGYSTPLNPVDSKNEIDKTTRPTRRISQHMNELVPYHDSSSASMFSYSTSSQRSLPLTQSMVYHGVSSSPHQYKQVSVEPLQTKETPACISTESSNFENDVSIDFIEYTVSQEIRVVNRSIVLRVNKRTGVSERYVRETEHILK